MDVEPTIVIACKRVPVRGSVDEYMLQPIVSMDNMPGATKADRWYNVHTLLAQSLQIVAQEIVKEFRVDSKIMVVPGMPEPLVRH